MRWLEHITANPQHPAWPLLRIVTITLCASFVLMVTASSFDESELKAIGGIGVGAGVVEFAKRKLVG